MTREEAIKWLKNLKEDIGHPRHEALWHYEQALDEIIQTLTQEPKTGEWILECDGGNECDNLYRCSTCGVECGCEEYDKPNFCPNCGADMRGNKE